MSHTAASAIPLAVYSYLSRQKSASGRRALRACLERMSQWCGQSLFEWQPHLLGRAGILAIVQRIHSEEWAPAYMALHECALSGVIEECIKHNLLSADAARQFLQWRRTKPKRNWRQSARGRYLSLDQRESLWKAASALGKTPAAIARDRAFLTLLLCGLSRDECVSLERQQLSLGGVLTVTGRGGKPRRKLMGPLALDALKEWLTIRGDKPGALLRPVNRHGSLGEARWSLAGASKRFQAITRAAGVGDVTPQDAKRTYDADFFMRQAFDWTVSSAGGSKMSQDDAKLSGELPRTDEDWRGDPRLAARLELALARERVARLRQELAEAEAAVRRWSDILGEAP